ncbi:MAG TPA: DUF2141 domain-containing protein [Acidobacteriota bacterium]
MRKVGTCLMPLSALLVLFFGEAVFGADVTVKVTGFHNQKGKALVYLWNGEAGFPKDTEKAFQQKTAEIKGDSVTVVFTGIAPGSYAASVTHDENGNGKMDTGFMGKPKEGYGASNNVKHKMSPPSFDESKFVVDASGKSIEIQLNY